jgi:DNA polymerase III epsilon subunit-like protein
MIVTMSTSPTTATNQRKCGQCNRSFNTLRALGDHLKDTDHSFVCVNPDCRELCKSATALAQHMANGHSTQGQPATQHANSGTASSSTQSLYCPQLGCRKTFKTEQARKQHLSAAAHKGLVTMTTAQQTPNAASRPKRSEAATASSKQLKASENDNRKHQEQVVLKRTNIQTHQGDSHQKTSTATTAKGSDSKSSKPLKRTQLFSWDSRWSAIPPAQYESTHSALRALVETSGSTFTARVDKKFYTPDVKSAPIHNPKTPRQRAIVLDCEMVGVGREGSTSELARISAIDFFTGILLVDTLVEPLLDVTDWRTKWSGVTAKAMNEAVASGDAVKGSTAARTELFKFMDSQTILVGHSLQFDLAALGIHHDATVDSSILAKSAVGKGVKQGWALKTLCKEFLKITVQDNGRNGHDAVEDALAAREVVLWCLQHKAELKSWGKKKRKEHTKKLQTKKRPVVQRTIYWNDSDNYDLDGSDSDYYEFRCLSTKELNELCHYPEWYDNWD